MDSMGPRCIMAVLLLSLVVLPSVAAFGGIGLLPFRSHTKRASVQLFETTQEDDKDNRGEFSRFFRHGLSPLDEKVVKIQESCQPLVGMTIQHVDADHQFRIVCANATHAATFRFVWWKFDEIRFINTTVQELGLYEKQRLAVEQDFQETQRWYASLLAKLDGQKELSPIDQDMVKIANYQKAVRPAVGATIQGVYLGGGTILSFGDPSADDSVEGWTELYLDLGKNGWLCCYNAWDENGYSFSLEKPTETELLCCTGDNTIVTSLDEKSERVRDAVVPLIGTTIKYFETMETCNKDGEWQDHPHMPIRIVCSNETVLSFGWGKADSIRVAECESPDIGRVSVGDLTLVEAVAATEEQGNGNPSSNRTTSPLPRRRWKRNGIESIQGAIGRTIQGAGLGSNSLNLDLGDEKIWLEVYNELDKNGYDFYHKNRTKDVE